MLFKKKKIDALLEHLFLNKWFLVLWNDVFYFLEKEYKSLVK